MEMNLKMKLKGKKWKNRFIPFVRRGDLDNLDKQREQMKQR